MTVEGLFRLEFGFSCYSSTFYYCCIFDSAFSPWTSQLIIWFHILVGLHYTRDKVLKNKEWNFELCTAFTWVCVLFAELFYASHWLVFTLFIDNITWNCWIRHCGILFMLLLCEILTAFLSAWITRPHEIVVMYPFSGSGTLVMLYVSNWLCCIVASSATVDSTKCRTSAAKRNLDNTSEKCFSSTTCSWCVCAFYLLRSTSTGVKQPIRLIWSLFPSLLWLLMVGWQEAHPAHNNLCHVSPKVPRRNRWRNKTEREPSNQIDLWNRQ